MHHHRMRSVQNDSYQIQRDQSTSYERKLLESAKGFLATVGEILESWILDLLYEINLELGLIFDCKWMYEQNLEHTYPMFQFRAD